MTPNQAGAPQATAAMAPQGYTADQIREIGGNAPTTNLRLCTLPADLIAHLKAKHKIDVKQGAEFFSSRGNNNIVDIENEQPDWVLYRTSNMVHNLLADDAFSAINNETNWPLKQVMQMCEKVYLVKRTDCIIYILHKPRHGVNNRITNSHRAVAKFCEFSAQQMTTGELLSDDSPPETKKPPPKIRLVPDGKFNGKAAIVHTNFPGFKVIVDVDGHYESDSYPLMDLVNYTSSANGERKALLRFTKGQGGTVLSDEAKMKRSLAAVQTLHRNGYQAFGLFGGGVRVVVDKAFTVESKEALRKLVNADHIFCDLPMQTADRQQPRLRMDPQEELKAKEGQHPVYVSRSQLSTVPIVADIVVEEFSKLYKAKWVAGKTDTLLFNCEDEAMQKKLVGKSWRITNSSIIVVCRSVQIHHLQLFHPPSDVPTGTGVFTA